MAIEIFNDNVPMSEQRTKMNNNFAQVELAENKTDTITSGASTTLYLSEKAAYDYVQRQFYQSTLPTTKDGDTVILSATSGKSKYKIDDGGVIKEIIFDRACGNYMTEAQFTALNSVYLAGEILIESDTKRAKIGDGTTAWNSLSYSGIADFGGTASAGWTKMPNGLITHYGKASTVTTSSGGLDKTITLPFAFTTQMTYGHGMLDTGSTDWNSNQLQVHTRQTSLTQIRFFVESGLAASSSGYSLRYMIMGV